LRGAPGENAIDAGIVNDGVHATVCVDLLCEVVGLGRTAEISINDSQRSWSEICEGGDAILRARMQQDLVPLIEEGLRGSIAKPVCASGNEDATHRAVMLNGFGSLLGPMGNPLPTESTLRPELLKPGIPENIRVWQAPAFILGDVPTPLFIKDHHG
jgi:hypothetical protein